MKIAIPVSEGKLSTHFGHCDKFAFVDVDKEGKMIEGKELLDPPPHEPGILPKWLNEKGTDLVIAGGMGNRAQNLFVQAGIEVICGVESGDFESVVEDYLNGRLKAGENLCDH